ncbi:MAG: alpha/beta fold hydrolase, partial [Candidatus Hodarchaeales archaeon]
TTQKQNPILFLHGVMKSHGDFTWMKKWFKANFKANGWPDTALYAYNFDDRNNCSLLSNINNANKIKQWVEDILNETGAEKIDLVGHSMGGMSSRYYIKFLGGVDLVDDYVSLGSGHHSVNGSGFGGECGRAGVNALVKILNEGDETPGGILDDILGDRIDPIFGFMYNSTHVPGNISYTSIYSRDDNSVPYLSSILDGAINIEVQGLSHSELYMNWSVYKLVRTAVDDFNTTFLMTPPTLQAIAGDDQVELSWQAPVDDGGAIITEYKIYRATSSGGQYSFIGNTTTLSFIDLNVTNGENYYYVVTAVNSVGESEYSNEISAIPLLPISTLTTSLTTMTTTSSTPAVTPVFSFIPLLFYLLLLAICFRKKKL